MDDLSNSNFDKLYDKMERTIKAAYKESKSVFEVSMFD